MRWEFKGPQDALGHTRVEAIRDVARSRLFRPSGLSAPLSSSSSWLHSPSTATPAEWELVLVVPETESHGPGLGHASTFAPVGVVDGMCGQAWPGERGFSPGVGFSLPSPLNLEWWGSLHL